MNSFEDAYPDYARYPTNTPHHGIAARKMRHYCEALNAHSGRLFASDGHLGFWDLCHDDTDFSNVKVKEVTSLEQVRLQCLLGKGQDTKVFKHLQCRFVFLHSENSRSKLYTTKEMLLLTLTYHRVVPWFIDFLLPFGEQIEPLDPRLSAFRHKNYPCSSPTSAVPQLAWSGNEIHLCYNLRSVETTTSNPKMPYSIRQIVIYHSFDLKSGQAFWIVLKGNKSMSEDLQVEVRNMKWRDSSQEKTCTCSFESTLKIHLLICDWACENWRAYGNHLEHTMHELTKDAVNREVRPKPMPVQVQEGGRVQDLGKYTTTGFDRIFEAFRKRRQNSNQIPSNKASSWTASGTFEKCLDNATVQQPGAAAAAGDQRPYYRVRLPNLQQTQKNEEKVNEVLFSLKSNMNILRSLKEYYVTLRPDLSSSMSKHAIWFAERIDAAIEELETYHATSETIIKLYAQRKALLFGILDFQNMEASEELARKAQLSATRMESMTQKMEDLTRKTKKETTSMGVIAGVTMFFLPGTFVSTLMSTDIVKWSRLQEGGYQLDAAPGARNLFLALTLPLMLATFATWLFVKWYYNTRDENNDT